MKRLCILLFILFVSPVFAQQDAWVYFTDKPDTDYYLANPLEMLSQKALDRRTNQGIALDEKDVPIHPEYIDGVTTATGITVMAKSKWLNAMHVRGTIEDITALTSLSYVASVDFADDTLNGKPAKAKTKPTNKQLETQTEYNYGTGATQIQMLNGHLLHQANFTGTGMTIAVLDAGFPNTDSSPVMQHLYDNNLVLGGHNFVENSDNVYTGGSHGTMVLSTMGGYADNQLVGTAPDAFYYLFVTESMTYENPVEESFWVEAAEEADSLGVDVINTSLGYFTYENAAYSYTYDEMDGQTAFISRGADIAFSRGMFIVVSAGNSGFGANPHIGVPADAVNVLTVGAVDSSEQYAYFSSIGPSADNRIKPDVMAMGLGSAYAATDGNIYTGNGTSFSSPITAGLVACLWQALPDLTNAELLQLIKQSADRYTTPNAYYGYGIPDFWAAYQSTLDTPKADKNGITVYPNPVNDVVNINLPEGEAAYFVLYNNLGQIVMKTQLTTAKNQVDISRLSAGIYNYRIENALGNSTGKLVKN
ncbi:S8 family serine peptidase [Flavobacterium sp. RHBU_3]|uniref:S8 family serine peptidase n=1 Tax=Flavobacterium sp. RHBU_3 TaxID=3391184 RepID=UPI0039854664